MPEQFPKKYNPKDFEWNIYANWEKEWKFKPQESRSWETFYIPMPPPNVTWILHLWHAIMLTIEDIMTRYHRMKWDETLWLPGTDHAGISTQVKVEEKLAAEWIDFKKIPREEFLKHCWEWTENYGGNIQGQVKSMGSSCDWSREKFTLDEDLNKSVTKAFVDLYNKWLIYRWEYMVNYDPVLDTVVSDQEVNYKEEKTKLFHITYFVSWSDNEVVIATTRPETLLWDVAVAVHPKDKRYKKLIKWQKKLILPIVNKEIPIIADEMVDMDFWTWAVKITPAHDANDFATAKRHDLPLDVVVLDKDGKMTEMAWILSGQDYMTARNNIVELLRAKGNLIDVEDHVSRVWYWERTWAKIETIISKQWFVKIDPIVKKVIAGYKAKEFEIVPKRYNKIFEDWIFNLNDWCISRQLVWWHQIPVYYHNETGEILCTEDDMSWDANYTRDPDVLDTWFSSALWPFSTLGYNMWWWEQPEDFKKFYPAQVLETWHDIIFFWVVRMLLFWYEFTWQTPFEIIYLHGLVKDKHGKKMSKSLWNWIDPLDMIEKYWCDALRLTLAIGNTPWNDLKFDEDNVVNNQVFINKLWNASRFLHMNLAEKFETDISKIEKKLVTNYEELFFHEKWILSRIRHLHDLVTNSMETNDFSEAGIELQNFTRNEFCDYFIEEFKLTKNESKYGPDVIAYVLNKLLILWHPYIPFVTEEIYNKVGFKDHIIDSAWQEVSLPRDEWLEKDKILMIDIIKSVRNIRAENNVMPNKTIKLQIYARNKNAEFLSEVIDIIGWIVKSDETLLVSKKVTSSQLAYDVVRSGVEVYVDTSNALDTDKEWQRLKDQITDAKEYIAILDKKLLNESFVRNAPEKLVRAEMEKKTEAQEKLKKLQEKLEKIQ